MAEPKAIYGIIGYPLGHSLSPLMHNTAFHELKIHAEYKLFPLQEDELENFFDALRRPDSPIFGLNVTVPYKEAAMKYIDTATPLAQKIMAVNTIVINKQRKLIGYNTDAPGFLSHLVELGFDLKDKRVAILGAGGSARAILATMCMIPDRPESIRIYNRTTSRLDNLLNDLSQRFDTSIVLPVDSMDDLNIEISDLLINTTSVGLRSDDPCPVEPELFHPNLLVYDLIYNPKETPLLKVAKERSAKTANGLGMLFYQGILSLQHWVNFPLEDDVKLIIRQALEQAI